MPETAHYIVPAASDLPLKELVSESDPEPGRRFPFWERLAIGRLEPETKPVPGVLYVPDPTVSSTHCVITQDAAGRCFVRDLSLNGTRLDQRRLVPGAEVEIHSGQRLSVGAAFTFVLEGSTVVARGPAGPRSTQPVTGPVEVTVLVGDIRHFTKLVRAIPPDALQASVTAVIHELVALVGEYGGTVKEYPGDAILAYWESPSPARSAAAACRAALLLDQAVTRLASDTSVWKLPSELLRMDWALASGKVVLGRIGGERPVGLSMVGEAVVKAFRIEKAANDGTGPIVACDRTRLLARDFVRFRGLGSVPLEGFRAPEEIHAVEGLL
jgi:class 3 adenylate cyclase